VAGRGRGARTPGGCGGDAVIDVPDARFLRQTER